MSQTYNGPMDSVKDFSAGVLSGDMMSISDKLQKAKSNVGFRVNSAREMVMGIRGQTSMTPLERRSEIRQRRLELLGVRDEDSSSRPTRVPKSSNQISRDSSDGTSGMNNPDTVESDSPLMSEVNVGTKARAEERGFGQ